MATFRPRDRALSAGDLERLLRPLDGEFGFSGDITAHMPPQGPGVAVISAAGGLTDIHGHPLALEKNSFPQCSRTPEPGPRATVQRPSAGAPRTSTSSAASNPAKGGMAMEETSLKPVKRAPIMGISNMKMR